MASKISEVCAMSNSTITPLVSICTNSYLRRALLKAMSRHKLRLTIYRLHLMYNQSLDLEVLDDYGMRTQTCWIQAQQSQS